MIKKLLSVFDLTRLPRIVLRHRSLLWEMTKRNIESRYRGSLLGLVWSFAHPLLMLCVYTFVFSVVFKARWGADGVGTAGKGAFAVILFCGLAMYNLFSESVSCGCSSVAGNPNFVKKVIFPLEILPLAQVLSTFVVGMAWFVLLFFGDWLVLGGLSWKMVLLPVVLLPHLVFTLGITYFVASFAVYVRDTQYAVGILMQVLFFATPVFYPISNVPERFRVFLEMNPLTVFIEQARSVFLYGKYPDWKYMAVATLVALVVLQLGFFFFSRTKKGFADVI